MLRCVDGLIHYAIERQIGFERHQAHNIALNPELRNIRTRELIRGIADHYILPGEMEALTRVFDERMYDARRSFGAVPASQEQQYFAINGLLRYAKDLFMQPQDMRERMLPVRDYFEDMVSHLPWDVKANGLYPARDWMDSGLAKLTALQNIRFTRILLGPERGPAASDFVGGRVITPEDVANTHLFDNLSGQYRDVGAWPAICTVYRGGSIGVATHDATELDLGIMRQYGDKFLNLPCVEVCRFPEEMTVTKGHQLRHGGVPEETMQPEQTMSQQW